MKSRPDLVVDAESTEEKWSFYSGYQNSASIFNGPAVPRPDIFAKDWLANVFDLPLMISLYPPPTKDCSLLDPH